MKRLQQIGIAGMMLASLTAGSSTELGHNIPVKRPHMSVNLSRKIESIMYQQRMSTLATMLETDRQQLELQLTKIAHS